MAAELDAGQKTLGNGGRRGGKLENCLEKITEICPGKKRRRRQKCCIRQQGYLN